MIPAERAHLIVNAISHPGMSGKNNEDRFGVSAHYVDADKTIPSLLAVVADGIGGHRAGEVAAEIAVETISAAVATSDASQPVKILQEAVVRAGQLINHAAESDPAQSGMGSTCACAWVIDRRLYTVSVGDTRIYLIRRYTIHQLTTDHTWVQEAIERGMIKPEQARHHPNAHIIRRYLGSRQEVVPDTRLRLRPNESDAGAVANQGMLLEAGDIVLICSDGLTDLVEDHEILSAFRTHNVEGALEELVRLSNRRGGHDNITIVAMSMPMAERPTVPIPVLRSRRRLTSFLVLARVLALAGLAFFGGMYLYLSRSSGNPRETQTITPAFPASLFPTPQATSTLQALKPTPLPPGETPHSTFTPSVNSVTAPESKTPLAPPTLTPWPTNTLPP